jgi:hypothetical protein
MLCDGLCVFVFNYLFSYQIKTLRVYCYLITCLLTRFNHSVLYNDTARYDI